MELYIVGLVVFLFAFIIARFLLDKANLRLEPEKKALLVDIASAGRVVNLVVLAAIIGFFLLNLQYQWTDPVTGVMIYTILVVAFSIWANTRIYSRLKNKDFPQTYTRTFIVCAIIRLSGLALLVVSLGLQMKQ